MATLADSFLADFEGGDDLEDDGPRQGGESKVPTPDDMDPEMLPQATVKEIDFDDMDTKEEKGGAVTAVANLLMDAKLHAHVQTVDKLMKSTQDEHGIHKNVNREAEYPVIVKSNEFAVLIDNEIATVHKFIKDLYATKFGELEQMVQSPLDYARVVKVIGNQTDITLVKQQLGEIIPQATVLTITVTATSTIGKPLSDEDLRKALDACDTIIKLDEIKKEIYGYIESRMNFIAPNLSAIVGSDIAARLVGIAGGVTALSKIPACNVQVLGVKKKNTGGLSTANQGLHMGIISQCHLMNGCPKEFQFKLLRLISAKVVLAARMDSFDEDPNGKGGEQMAEEIKEKIEKWQEPPPPKKKRALPAPNDKQKKRRGGKRYRKYKEKFETTEIQKQKNRMVFGKAEHTDDFTGEGFGMLGQVGSGKLAVRAKDTQKLKNKLSKKTQARLAKPIKAPSGPSAGTASSIAFTPVQGIELVNPDLQQKRLEKVNQANKDYFSNTSSFFKVGTKTPLPGAASQPQPMDFKMPAPRPPKKA